MFTSSARNRKYLGLHHESVDSKIKFSIEPLPGDDAFDLWKDAMKAVAGLSMGIPIDYRKKVWLALADNYLKGLCIDWEKTRSLAFNRKSNPDDNKLDQQIVKDLHRTGCSGFSGHENEEDRAVLQRVLLAYARWNKQVGYCQGFNVIAALILDVMDRQEDCALKVMIYLIDRVLPESYFANNLRALSVDMAVFRHLLRLQLPRFSRHLDRLQATSMDQTTGASYEPPLTDVFTMQWFLTLFATCLPKSTALRIWDAVLLEGSQVLLRTAISIWSKLQERLLEIQTPDEFYTAMGSLSQEMLYGTVVEEDALIQAVYEMSSSTSATTGLNELRVAYSKRLDTVAAAGKRWLLGGGRNDDVNADDLAIDVNCFSGMLPFPQQYSPQHSGPFNRSDSGSSLSDTLQGSTGLLLTPFANIDKIAMDVDSLSKQYAKLQERQKQACIILAGARQNRPSSDVTSSSRNTSRTAETTTMTSSSSVAVNHLYIGREMTHNSRNRSAASTRSPGVTTSKSTVGRPHHLSDGGRHPSANTIASGDVTSASRLTLSAVDHKDVTEAVLTCGGGNVEVVVDSDCEGNSQNNKDASVSIVVDVTTKCFESPSPTSPLPMNSRKSALAAGVGSKDVDRDQNPVFVADASTPLTPVSTKYPSASPKLCGDSIHGRHEGLGSVTSKTAQATSAGDGSVSVSSPTSQLKAFNPFPKQHTRRRAMNGVRLGLYAAPPTDSSRS